MPIYEYQCKEHGAFEEMRRVSDYREPATCPVCLTECTRIVSARHLALMDPASRTAHDRNLKSRHEPHVCSHGAHSHEKGRQAPPPPRSTKMRVYNGPRPWVVEHG